MEERKKKHHNKTGQNEGGQRISVRPGNFAPPTQVPAPTPAATGGAPEHREGGNRHKHGRHGKHQNRSKQNAPEQQNRPKQNTPERQNNQQNEKKPDNGARNQENRGNGSRHDRNRHGRNRREENRVPEQKNLISEALQNELNEEFGSPVLESGFNTFRKDKKQEELVLDSDEFAVDIATAAYLLDDIPYGFPIPDGKAVEVVGVRFRRAGKVYFFAPGSESYRIGDPVLVDTARGEELGEIVMLKRKIAERQVIQPLRAVLRRGTDEDVKREAENRVKECEALKICEKKIAEHKLDMKLVDAQYTFDNSKLLFYFTSEGRVDFRDLVRDLAGIFHTRIELRQIGIRDEAKLIGGLGMCGRPFCCSTYLSDFGQVSIKMAKEQGLSINTSKISGCCGRLMCCLRYEHETYAEEAKLTPKRGSVVQTPDGQGVVEDSTPLAGTVKVKLNDQPDEPARVYHRDKVTVLGKKTSQGGAEHTNKSDNGPQNTQNEPADAPEKSEG